MKSRSAIAWYALSLGVLAGGAASLWLLWGRSRGMGLAAALVAIVATLEFSEVAAGSRQPRQVRRLAVLVILTFLICVSELIR